ncbi:unnamed protein product [Didymodactylos carnosus]|uniref:HTH CENPB-type domain-containing protein n=2 Tax=Philodinidae TaxID=44580 RepID=A0A813ZS67_9BILA|nr:unnamed protein product [Didymodactylos carnosus]CAF1138345.1 unnamed protein product [Didymodactylos carnosus]CAF3684756.1 unnamed protein product [Didymodactylos carnosus]CAF3929901.1 unnamed protein product [Didymodactylos carnosus]
MKKKKRGRLNKSFPISMQQPSDSSSTVCTTNVQVPLKIEQKCEPLDSYSYTADESAIADFMAVLPQLDPGDMNSTTINDTTSPTSSSGHGVHSHLTNGTSKFDVYNTATAAHPVHHGHRHHMSGAMRIATALVKKPQLSTLNDQQYHSSHHHDTPPQNSPNSNSNNTTNTSNKRKRKTEHPAQKRVRGSYKLVSPEQKVMIHEYAEKHGVKAASKLFQVAPSTIASWLYQKPNGERTSAIRNKEAHSRILEWVKQRRDCGERVNNKDFHSYALATMRELTGNPDFAASRSWCSNFIKKYQIQLDSDKLSDSSQFRFDSSGLDENASESSLCFAGASSPSDTKLDETALTDESQIVSPDESSHVLQNYSPSSANNNNVNDTTSSQLTQSGASGGDTSKPTTSSIKTEQKQSRRHRQHHHHQRQRNSTESSCDEDDDSLSSPTKIMAGIQTTQSQKNGSLSLSKNRVNDNDIYQQAVSTSSMLPILSSSSSLSSTNLASKRTINRLLHSQSTISTTNSTHHQTTKSTTSATRHLSSDTLSYGGHSSTTHVNGLYLNMAILPQSPSQQRDQQPTVPTNTIEHETKIDKQLVMHNPETTTQSVETFVQHYEGTLNTMTYFQEKLRTLVATIAQERDALLQLYLKERDRRIVIESRLKEIM